MTQVEASEKCTIFEMNFYKNFNRFPYADELFEYAYNEGQKNRLDLFSFQADLEKENEQLKLQIEKMKRCNNCIHFNSDFQLCNFSGGDEDYTCRNRRWEFKE